MPDPQNDELLPSEGGLVERAEALRREMANTATFLMNDKALTLISDMQRALASRPSVSGEVEELMEEMKGLQKIAAGYHAKLCEQQAQLATLRKLVRECVKDERAKYGSEACPTWADCGCAGPMTEKLADAIAAFPTPTAQEKENGRKRRTVCSYGICDAPDHCSFPQCEHPTAQPEGNGNG